MSEQTRSIIIRVPTLLNIGPVPNEVQGHNALLKFALANTQRILDATGVETRIKGEEATISYKTDDDKLRSFAATGRELSNRHFRIDPREDGLHALEVSTDGQEYTEVGLINDPAFAELIGEAWVAGKVEPQS